MVLKYFLTRSDTGLQLDCVPDTPALRLHVEQLSGFARWMTEEDLRNITFIVASSVMKQDKVNWQRDGF